MKKFKFYILLNMAILFVGRMDCIAQEYFSHPGIDKFAGWWEYKNGADTIRMKCIVRYIGNNNLQVKTTLFYYTFKKGSLTLRDNFQNSSYINLADLGGSYTKGSLTDSLVVSGEDKSKRKIDEGYFIINGNNTQLKWVRVIGIHGGGIRFYYEGQGPLPGYTLPETILFNKVVFEEAKGVGN